MTRKRLDLVMVERGLAASREQARSLIMSGAVTVGGKVLDKAGIAVDESVLIEVAEAPRFVSRGGLKLERALDAFALDVTGLVCLDVGASTGGFTDCLLQRGATRVYALDVGYGQLDWRLRTDPRVVVMERTNARRLEYLPERPSIATMDVSFISLRLVIPPVAALLAPEGRIVALVKPQFEAGRARVSKGGVVKDPEVHREVLAGLAAWGAATGCGFRRVVPSPVRGPAGNVEFLALVVPGAGRAEDLEQQIDMAIRDAQALKR